MRTENQERALVHPHVIHIPDLVQHKDRHYSLFLSREKKSIEHFPEIIKRLVTDLGIFIVHHLRMTWPFCKKKYPSENVLNLRHLSKVTAITQLLNH